ncbi:MAG TPA: Gfo/Idh/MocA family oxidoreductase [Anditalea sp.]|nr:Gfo/Idh/MocA family oxidoreductase [Anditalea sp.]
MKLNFGILSTAKIAMEKVIPAMVSSENFQVHGIASRDITKANAAAKQFNIQKTYGSYEEMISDPDIHVIYNPLPNHLHVEYTLKCIEAGKHVLCEKPIALNSADINTLIQARDKYKVKVGEAFMVKTHPQWIKAKNIVQEGKLGHVKLIQGCFSYFNNDPNNIRNVASFGGGAMWDIGCYPVMTSRFVLNEEPQKVLALMEYDKEFGTDILSSVVMQFPTTQAVFTVGTQMVPYQRMHFMGSEKRLEIVIPFNSPNDRPTKITLDEGGIYQNNLETIEIDTCDQYALQAEDFIRSIIDDSKEPVSLEEALANTRVLEAIFISAKEERWVRL